MITQSALMCMAWTRRREVPHGAGGQRRDDAAAGLEGGAEALQAATGGEIIFVRSCIFHYNM
jgi:hypothetical protein